MYFRCTTGWLLIRGIEMWKACRSTDKYTTVITDLKHKNFQNIHAWAFLVAALSSLLKFCLALHPQLKSHGKKSRRLFMQWLDGRPVGTRVAIHINYCSRHTLPPLWHMYLLSRPSSLFWVFFWANQMMKTLYVQMTCKLRLREKKIKWSVTIQYSSPNLCPRIPALLSKIS